MSSISWVPYLLQILREVGLKHKVDDAETFTACAQRVAANWADAAVSYEPAAAAAAAMKVRSKCTGIAARLDVLTLTPRNALPPLQCWRPRRHVHHVRCHRLQAAELLAMHLATKADALFAPHVFHQLGSIAFVPAIRVRDPQYSPKLRLATCTGPAFGPHCFAFGYQKL